MPLLPVLRGVCLQLINQVPFTAYCRHSDEFLRTIDKQLNPVDKAPSELNIRIKNKHICKKGLV